MHPQRSFKLAQVAKGETPVILLGGEAIALSIARTLGKRGIEVLALDAPTSYVRHSRFSTWIPLEYESDDVQKLWLRWLLTIGREHHRGAILFPCCDDGLELIARHRNDLAADFTMTEADDRVTLAMLDKETTAEMSNRIGIPSPRLWHISNAGDMLNAIAQVEYPCVLKPRHSHLFARHFSAIKLFVSRNAEELMSHFRQIEPLGLEMIVTEIIPGDDDQYYSYYSYLDENGTPLFHFTKRKLRQLPVGFGQWTYHISGSHPDAAELGLKFFQDIGLRGIGTVEFKRDARDGKLKLIECNPRFTLAIELLKFSGIDWASFVYNKLTGQPLPPVQSFKEGVRVIRPLSDLLAFRDLRRAGKISTGDWMRSVAHRQHFQYFRWSDLMPSLTRIIPFIRKRMRSSATHDH